jgi:hypothetical protein
VSTANHVSYEIDERIANVSITVTIGGAIAFLVFGVIYIYECLMEA